MSNIKIRAFGVTLNPYTKKVVIPVDCRHVLKSFPEIVEVVDYNNAFSWVSATFTEGVDYKQIEQKLNRTVSDIDKYREA